jgi:hypothetical protein
MTPVRTGVTVGRQAHFGISAVIQPKKSKNSVIMSASRNDQNSMEMSKDNGN